MKRQLLFIFLSISTGAGLIAIVLYFDFVGNIDFENKTSDFSNISYLEGKINNSATAEYKPDTYLCLNAEIHSSHSIGLITQSTEDKLMRDLMEKQWDKLEQKCKNYLMGTSDNYSATKLINWLSEYNQIYPENKNAKIYIGQINAQQNYVALGERIVKYTKISPFPPCINYSEISDFNKKLDDMYGIKTEFRGSRKLIRIKVKSKDELNKYARYWIDNWGYGSCLQNK
jgi:hypothetical protein